MKILTIVGARPQFIKAAIVSQEFQKHPKVSEIVIHTGQHFDANMSAVFFEQMGIRQADYSLNISNLGHGAMTGRMLEEIEKILLQENPDWVLVYGDTNSTLAGALAASKLHIKVAHVEAGLRSFNMKMPEEQNRILTDQLSSILFCPTSSAIANLKSEGFDGKRIKVLEVGDVMLDAAIKFQSGAIRPEGLGNVNISKPFILSTVHRAENTDNEANIRNIISALNRINEEVPVILPLHPRTKNIIQKLKLSLNVAVIEPIGYLEMVYLLQRCKMVICDSGGLQKEAYFFEKPCITMREETEWVELVEMGVNVLAGARKDKILDAYHCFQDKRIERVSQHYGGGNACTRIVNELITYE